jgi:transcriptional regulator with XRE-family HTH domain
MASTDKPYSTLGQHLKTVREQAKKSLAEVSGAVEIEEKHLILIEEGLKRPEEDVMLLLISYFNIADQEALHLWELAKYDSDLNEHLEFSKQAGDEKAIQNQLIAKPMIMVLSMDVRTMYSDGIEVTTNDAGLTLTFTQTGSQKGQTLPIAKVGMSYAQVEKVQECIARALLHAKYNGSPKLLPPPTSE